MGPALALSVALASGRTLSSEIILCTDGVPNTGVGSLSCRRDFTGFYSTVSSEIILCTDGVPNTGVGSLSCRRDFTGFYSTVCDTMVLS